MKLIKWSQACVAALALTAGLHKAVIPANGEQTTVPKRSEGEGPYDRLILRGVYFIDGAGAPTQGPADIVVVKDRIAEIHIVGHPLLPIDPEKRPPLNGGRELDFQGMYVLPGFIDTHAHLHSMKAGQKVPPEYPMKLWLAHGITTARALGPHDETFEWLLDVKRRSDRNEVTGPRLHLYPHFSLDTQTQIKTPADARARVREIKRLGGVGIKFGFAGGTEEILWAALEEADKIGLNTTIHHAQPDVLYANVLTTSAHGLKSMEHWYGLPEAMFEDRRIQAYPNNYLYHDEQHRFAEAGRLWKQTAKPGSEKWNSVIDTLISRNFGISPTMTAYLTSRDFMRMSRAIWHETYTTPSLWDFYRPNRDAHGSYWFYWTLEDEIAWKENYVLWMRFLNDYKNRGGRVTVGSDSGYIYNLYGFGYIQEMHLLREAGFSPLEVVHAATLQGARVVGVEADVGSINVGKKADFVVVKENPLENLHVLFATGTLRLNDETRAVERVGGIRYVIKDGIVYDNRELLRRIREIVQEEKRARGIGPGPMPIETVPQEQ
jgi:imidazolonepropionase-like amidohydrolase